MNKDFFIKQLDSILADFTTLKSICEHNDFSGKNDMVHVTALIAKSRAAIEKIAGINSEYYKTLLKIYEDKQQIFHDGLRILNIIGIVTALKEDLENDFLITIKELVHAEIFSDYLEMAEYLLSEGYKDSAAVIAGSTLESHLRALCNKNGIDIELVNNKGKINYKKADKMNADLYKATIYNKTFQKQITAWLDLRNNAAHGKYSEYTPEEVNLLISGLRNFMMTYVA